MIDTYKCLYNTLESVLLIISRNISSHLCFIYRKLKYYHQSRHLYNPISYDRPFGLWIGMGTGLEMHHSYQTCFLLFNRQK